ncbi:hypothetical protein RF11_03009 [Thelohanellus kitauei]|uniref:Uncharacterized protein n=1 Tax=Thelohanellus kitauei TaxID=669202 RepID=A0A0C2JG14_THEKT|nr:hypothetical protein RF11_03009 [Thelohanellus kitauei]
MDVGRLADLASHGLLSQKQKTFKECYKVLIEFFTNASSTNRQKKQETKSIVVRLYDSQVHQIVKNCIEVILTSTNLWNVRECGNMLRIMNNANRSGIESKIKIDTKLIKEMLQKYMNEIRSDESVCDDMEDILSAPSKEKAEEMAKKINFKFCKS